MHLLLINIWKQAPFVKIRLLELLTVHQYENDGYSHVDDIVILVTWCWWKKLKGLKICQNVFYLHILAYIVT